MKINVYGFRFNKSKLPERMRTTDVFVRMQKEPGMKVGETYRYGADKVVANAGGSETEWWGGIILKLRDAKAFTKLTEGDGEMVLTAETLAKNEKLVELTYFVAHPDTGSGLLAQHYHGASIPAFDLACSRVFKTVQKEAIEIASRGKSAQEQKAIAKQYRGSLPLEQIARDTNLKDLVKQLKHVSSFELKLFTLETNQTFLRGIVEKASRSTLRLTFPSDAIVAELAEIAGDLSGNKMIEGLKVSGYDEQNLKHAYHDDRNPLVFDVLDYDKFTSGLRIDLSDWGKSINSSEMIRHLIKVASVESNYSLLTTP